MLCRSGGEHEERKGHAAFVMQQTKWSDSFRSKLTGPEAQPEKEMSLEAAVRDLAHVLFLQSQEGIHKKAPLATLVV